MFLILKSTILLGMETEMKSPSIVSGAIFTSFEWREEMVLSFHFKSPRL